ncbi:uroporphyrinogen-III synthase [Arthrobacter sp. LAPM80]|uniref:uroporphyrinogen-III synthase n=1 Tax=Arthrobacter sp. LAPM80 TaxID=3141788 RepID=UPI00398B90C5
MDGTTGTALPLAGLRIGVTAHRRAAELIGALKRRGATVLHAPALKVAPFEDDGALLAEIRAVIDAAPEIVMVTTAYGLRRWCDAAEAAGLSGQLMDTLARADIYVRGPKGRGAVRGLGLDDVGISSDETTATLTELVIDAGVAGKTVALQVHGFTDVDALARLGGAGARVLTVTPYRWVTAEEGDSMSALINAVANRELDALTFTSAPAVDAVLSSAAQSGRAADFLAALRGPGAPGPGSGVVVSAAVGPVTAAPLVAAGIEPIVPERFRMGALVKLVTAHLTGMHDGDPTNPS